MNKRFIPFLLGLVLNPMAYAEPSSAVTFASQAGVIAGAAQTCGQPIGVMTERTTEVIKAIATDPTDVNNALASFQRASQDSSASQNLSQQLTCTKVVSDFNNLPLLRPDYQQTVIQPLIQPDAPATTVAPTLPAMATTADAVPIPPSFASAAMTPAPTQQIVRATPVVPMGATTTPAASTNAASNDATRLQLAQQLTQLAQTLVTPQAQLQQQNPSAMINNQFQNSADNIDQIYNKTNNPAYNQQLGVTPYPPGQTMNTPIDPGVQPYPAPASYPP